MRYTRLIALLALPVLFASLDWAQQGESVYKSKCAACRGPTAEGKIGAFLEDDQTERGRHRAAA